MSGTILMPSLSPTMEDATVDRWFVAVGDVVQKGDVIAEVTTDKATLEIEADQSGRIAEILVDAGTQGVLVNAPLALLEEIEAADTAEPSPRDRRGRPMATGVTVRQALQGALADEMARDDTIFVIGEEVGVAQGVFKITEGLLERFGSRRVVDAPTTPAGVAALAVGAAYAGLRPVVEFMNFAYAFQALDQIANGAAASAAMSGGALRCPVVFRGPHGAPGRVGAQHSRDVAALFARFPGLTVAAPYAASDAAALLRAALRSDGPVIFLESEKLYGKSFPEQHDAAPVAFGQAKVTRSGGDVTLISFGAGMLLAEAATAELFKEGIDVELIDLRSLKPLDDATILASVRKTNRCVVVEEGGPVCGVGDHVAALVMRKAFDYLDAPVLPVSAADQALPYAAALEEAALASSKAVIDAVRTVCNR